MQPFIDLLTVQSYARQINILTNQTTALGVCLILVHKDLIGSMLIGLLKKLTLM
jgi:hypothetical protein